MQVVHQSNSHFEGWSSVDPKVWWNALVQDTEANITIIDYEGCLLFYNEALRRNFGLKDLGSTTLNLNGVLPQDVAEERLQLIRTSIDTGLPFTVYGMLRGIYHCTMIRPISSSTDCELRAILIVCNAVTNENHSSLWQLGSRYEVVYAESHDMGHLEDLTLMELKVLKMIGNSLTNVEMAKELHRSDKTIERYRNSLGRKLGARNRVDLAQIANASGILLVDLNKLFS